MASEFIEIISEQTKAQIDAIMPLVRELAKSIKDINSFSVSATPSGADKNINAMNEAYKKRAESIAKVRGELEKTTAIQKQIENSAKNQTTATQNMTKAELGYVTAIEKGVKAKEKEVLANKKLNDAYGQLTTKRNEAARALQNSIVATGKYSVETKKLQKEFDVLNRKVGDADKAIGKFSQSNNQIQTLVGGVRNLMGAFGLSTGLYLAVDIAKNIYETTKQLQSLDLALKMVSGSQEEFQANQLFLKTLAEQYGIEIKGLTKNFTEFWVASKGKLEAEQIKAIFTSISKSVAVMGLSVEQQDSAFLALQQMMSKGTVQAEELKKQLGNALPGAVKAATMAYQALHPEMKVTEELFMKQMKAGKVLSAELLPELARAYEKLYGIENIKRAETLQAAQERLANSWTDAIRRMTGGNSIFTKMLSSFMDSLKWWLDNAESVLKYTSLLGYGISKIYGLIYKEELRLEQSKTNQEKASKQALKDVEKIYETEKKLSLTLSVKNQELEKYESIKKTAKGKDLIDINEKIKKTKEEIEILNVQMNQEILLNKKRKDFKLKESLVENKKLEADNNKLLLDRVNLLEKQKQIFTDIEKNRKSGEYSASREKELFADRDRVASLLDEKKVLLATNNARIAYNNAIINSRESAKSNVVKTVHEETEKEREAREKAQEEKLKDIYNMNKAELEHELTKAKLILENDLKSYDERFSALDRYNEIKKQLNALGYKQELDLAKNNQFKQKEALSKYQTEALIQLNEFTKKRLELLRAQSKDESLDDTIKELEKSQDEINKKKTDLEEKSAKEFVETTKKIDKQINKERTEEQKRQFEASLNAFNTFVGDFAGKSGFGETFNFFAHLDEDGRTMFQKLLDDAKNAGDEYKVIFQGITTAAQDAFNLMSEASQNRLDAEYKRLEKQHDVAIEFAGDSASAKKKIDDDYEKRKAELDKRAFKQKQQQALANIAIDTAQAIMQIWSHSPDPTGISQGLMTAVISGIGLIQAGMVKAQKYQEYWQGTDNAEAGLAWTQERGAEIITDKKGNIKDFGDNKGARLTKMEKGDKVYTASETKQMMFNRELNSLMLDNGIGMSKVVVNNSGLSKSDMREVMIETLGSQPQQHMGFDKGGFYSYLSKNGNITKRLEDRGNGSGHTF